jgi:hypothetical protein
MEIARRSQGDRKMAGFGANWYPDFRKNAGERKKGALEGAPS